VHHRKGRVVAGVGDAAVEEQSGADGLVDPMAGDGEHGVAGLGMASRGAYIRFDHRDGSAHVLTPFLISPLGVKPYNHAVGRASGRAPSRSTAYPDCTSCRTTCRAAA